MQYSTSHHFTYFTSIKWRSIQTICILETIYKMQTTKKAHRECSRSDMQKKTWNMKYASGNKHRQEIAVDYICSDILYVTLQMFWGPDPSYAFTFNVPVSCNIVNTCHPHAQCIFIPPRGQYQCQCNAGYEGDGYECAEIGKLPFLKYIIWDHVEYVLDLQAFESIDLFSQ